MVKATDPDGKPPENEIDEKKGRRRRRIKNNGLGIQDGCYFPAGVSHGKYTQKGTGERVRKCISPR
jgi:hypothetical protein